MLSRLNSLSVEGEAEAEKEITKEEGEVQAIITEVKVTHIKPRIIISNLKESKGEDQMKKQAYNAITTKSMGTMKLNDG
jgi:hypothetical protein